MLILRIHSELSFGSGSHLRKLQATAHCQGWICSLTPRLQYLTVAFCSFNREDLVWQHQVEPQIDAEVTDPSALVPAIEVTVWKSCMR